MSAIVPITCIKSLDIQEQARITHPSDSIRKRVINWSVDGYYHWSIIAAI